MKKGIASILLLFMLSIFVPGALFFGSVQAADTITWGDKQSGVYDKLHPYTLNWSGDVLDRGGLNLLELKYTTSSSDADIVINQYGDIGALAIRKLDSEDLTKPTDRNVTGFTNSLEIEQGAVYLVVLHDGSHSKIKIDRILPDNGFSITKVTFSYVLEVPEQENDGSTNSQNNGTSPPVSLDLGSPEKDILNPSAVYEFEENGSITLPWKQLNGHVSWDIYRSDNGKPYVKMTDFKLTEPQYIDNYTFAGHTYLYKIASYDRNDNLISISSALKVTIVKKASQAPVNEGNRTPVNEGNRILLQIDNTTALVNLKSHTLETAPFIYDGRTLVPLRFISEALGAQVKWNGEQRSITLTVGQDTIVLVIGQSAARVNGKTVMMDVPAMIYNNTTMVPVRFVSEQLNQKITFNDETRTILIVSKDAAEASDDNSLSTSDPADYFIGKWNMWVPAGRDGASGGTLTIAADGTISFYWNGPQTGTWTLDQATGKLLLSGYKSGWDWTVTRTEDGITVSTFGVHETGTRAK